MAEAAPTPAATPTGGGTMVEELHLVGGAGRAHRDITAEMVAPVRKSDEIVEVHGKKWYRKFGKIYRWMGRTGDK